MLRQRGVLTIVLALALGVALPTASRDASAEVYAGNQCASEKLQLAADRCDKTLKIWSLWELTQFDLLRDLLLEWHQMKLDGRWTGAEELASLQGVDCADMTISSSDLVELIDAAVGDIVTEINTGLDLSGDTKNAICGANLLRLAAAECRSFLQAEGKHVRSLSRDPDGARRDREQARASALFNRGWDWATWLHCPTAATAADIEGRVGALSGEVLTAITVSPNVPDDGFMAITHPGVGEPGHEVAYEGDVLGPRCQDSSSYSFFARRGTENKLLVYYEGGGACWDTLTCGLPLCKQDVNPEAFLASADEGFGGGFGDLSNPDNPFATWNIVYVPYCSCDVHWGDSAVDYPAMLGFPEKHVEHRGYDNAKLVEKWTREHFVDPTDVFVSGSSAGAYGATMYAVALNEVYPASSINMLADAGNGVITKEFLEQQFGNWGVEQNLPDVPGIGDVPVTEQSMPGIVAAAARYYPRSNWAHYTTAYDGGTGGQTGFYHVMLHPDNIFVWPNWWESSCAFHTVMRQQALDTAALVAAENDNYRYYIASGSAHTGFGRNRAYTDTTGGVPTLVDWVGAMIGDTEAWVNVEASPANVLFAGECSPGSDNPGAACDSGSDCPNGSCQGADPRPNPLQPPFEMVGTDTIVNCGP